MLIPVTFGNLLLKLELMGINVIKPGPYYLSPGQGGDQSGPYSPPIITSMDGETMEQFP